MKIQERLAQYAPVRLKFDLSPLTASERKIVPLLIEAAQAMEDAFWVQAYGDREALLALTADPDVKRFIRISYGPWDANNDDDPVLDGVGSYLSGANFYPPDMTEEEFEAEAALRPELKSSYSMVRRDHQGKLEAIPYHQFFRGQVGLAAGRLRQAAGLAEDAKQKSYLNLRAEALLTDDYRPSDFAWMDMQANHLELLIGPMETSMDQLLGVKTAYAASVLIKDGEWSERLARYVGLLPRFQKNLPVAEVYKREQPGLDSDLFVYDLIYCAGYDNASIPMGINWPEDEEVRRTKGTRSMIVKNVIRAKYEKLLVPIADLLIASDQRPYVTFEAFFNYVMAHEIAHGLGINQTITGKGSVREALKDENHAVEEGKADVLSLFVITQLNQPGKFSEGELNEVYITFLANLLRNSDSRQALMQLNFFKKMGAYARDANTKTYRVNLDRMPAAITALSERLLHFQGDGDYAGAQAFMDRYAEPDEDLKDDIEQLASIIQVCEIVLEQG